MKTRQIISGILSAAVVIASLAFAVPSVSAQEDLQYSQEYKSSPYYTKLTDALESSKDETVMQKTLAVALSQEGYKNYATEGINIEQAKKDGLLWTGAELRMNGNNTGNTEYTRWAQRYIMDRAENTQYLDCDWCAIFVSWCLYQAGYNNDERLKRYYYSYFAEPRISYDADSWIEAYNFKQQGVYYTPKAHHKLDKYNWNTYYNIDVDAFDIPYQPGGLIFFSWDASGAYFDHVAIVVDYNKDTHVLSYTNGNSGGQVITRQIDLDNEEEFRGQKYAKNSDRIMAYVAYDGIPPLEEREVKAEVSEIEWNRDGTSGIKIQTDSESVIGTVYMDGSYLGDTIVSNMLLHEGLLSIGKSELVGFENGEHTMTLSFDEGTVNIKLKIVETYIMGDADGDGRITISDATLIQRAGIGLEQLSEVRAKAADVNGDGRVSVLDATCVQKYLAEYTEGTGSTGSSFAA